MLPDFVIIGAPRAGTTWLYEQLRKHPRLFLSENKEPRYFATAGIPATFTGPGDDKWAEAIVTDRCEYEALFAASGDRLRGEASTDYLYQGHLAAASMRDLTPLARIIVVLREPAERAHSAWKMLRQQGYEQLDFDAALARESNRIGDGWAWCWHYTQHGFYTRNLEPFFVRFDPQQILTLCFQDIARDPQRVLDTVTEFLDVPHLTGSELGRRINERSLTRGTSSEHLRRLVLGRGVARLAPKRARRGVRAFVDRMTLYNPVLDEEARVRLKRLYRADLGLLPDLIGRKIDLET